MKVPPEAVETVRSVFLRANRAATRMLSEAPNAWETSLDMAVITALNQYSAPIQPVRDCFVSIQTHFFGGRRLYERWEIADIGLLVMFRVKGRLVRTKLALLQSKRLYPKEISGASEDERFHYRAGFSRLYREQEDYDADVRARTFTWDLSSEYKAIEEGDDQERAIEAYEKQRNIPVYYLLYHPFRLGWNISVPIWGPRRRASYKLGTRVVPSTEIRSACASLTSGKSPSAGMLKQVRTASYRGNDALGCRLEDFVADRVLGCEEGYLATNPEDFALEQVFFNRSGPIAAAIAITVDLPEGD